MRVMVLILAAALWCTAKSTIFEHLERIEEKSVDLKLLAKSLTRYKTPELEKRDLNSFKEIDTTVGILREEIHQLSTEDKGLGAKLEGQFKPIQTGLESLTKAHGLPNKGDSFGIDAFMELVERLQMDIKVEMLLDIVRDQLGTIIDSEQSWNDDQVFEPRPAKRPKLDADGYVGNPTLIKGAPKLKAFTEKDHLTFVKELGRGTGGVAYLCQKSQKLMVAKIKDKCRYETKNDKQRGIEDRLKLEYDMLSKIDSPNVIKALGFIRHENQVAILMEYFDGQTLEEFIKDCRDPETNEYYPNVDVMTRAAWEIATGLRDCHKAEVLHRDLNEKNILLKHEEDGRVRIKLIDFDLGIGENQNPETPGLGPRYFVKPGLSETYTRKDDWYAFGKLLYYMYTGKLVSNEAEFLQESENQLPSEIRSLVDCMCQPPYPVQCFKTFEATWNHLNVQELIDEESC